MTAKAKLATGEVVDGKVSFISKTADLATRTFKVELEVANPGERMREGVTTELSVGLPPQLAQKLPGSILISQRGRKIWRARPQCRQHHAVHASGCHCPGN